MTARVLVNPRNLVPPVWALASIGALGILAPTLIDGYGGIAAAAICLLPIVLGWIFLLRSEIHGYCISLLHSITPMQAILLLLVCSVFIEDFFPEIADRLATDVAASPVNPVNLARIIAVALGGLGAAYYFVTRPHILLIGMRGPLGWMLLFAAATLASVTYSSLPLVAAGKAIEFSVDVIFAVLMASIFTTDDLRKSWNLFWAVITGMVVMAWITALAVPSGGFEWPGGLLQGFRPNIHANTIGQFGASLALIGCNRLLGRPFQNAHSKLFWAGFTALGAATLLASQARTSALAFPVALGVCFYLQRRWMPLMVAGGAGVLAALSGWSQFVLEFLRRNQDADQLTTLSGRLRYWAVAWNYFKEAIWFGHGYYTSARLDMSVRYGHDLSTVDNTYLEVLLGVGIIGAIPLIVALLLLLKHALKRTQPRDRLTPNWNLKVEMIGVWIILMVRSATGSTFQVHSERLFMLLIMMAFFQCLAREKSPLAIHRQSMSARRLALTVR